MGLRSEYKSLEQSWMMLKDQYSELARAIGFEGDAWFNDPLASHEEILKRAKELEREMIDKADRLSAISLINQTLAMKTLPKVARRYIKGVKALIEENANKRPKDEQ